MKMQARVRVDSNKGADRADKKESGRWFIAECTPVEPYTGEVECGRDEVFREKVSLFLDSKDPMCKEFREINGLVNVELDVAIGSFKNDEGKWYPRHQVKVIRAKAVAAATA